MGELIVVNRNLRSLADERAIEADRVAFKAAYDELAEALDRKHRQMIQRAIPAVEALPLERYRAAFAAGAQVATKAEIAVHVTKLVAVMKHFSGAIDLPAYIETLTGDLDDLADPAANLLGLAMGCKKIRLTCKTFPSIADVVEAVRAASSEARAALDRVENRLPEKLELARAFLLRST